MRVAIPIAIALLWGALMLALYHAWIFDLTRQ